MALLTCPECDGKVSSRANKCVHCGFPLESQDDSEAGCGCLFLILLGLILYMCT